MRLPKLSPQAIRYGAAGLAGVALYAASLFIPHEGLKYAAYQDSVGVWTICHGHTKGVKPGDTATEKQCAQYLAEDMQEVESAFNRLVTRPVPDSLRVAVYSFIFNVGTGNFAKSTMLKKLNAGDFVGACREFDRWMYAGGKDCRVRSNNCYGIVKRRLDEKNMCMGVTQ